MKQVETPGRWSILKTDIEHKRVFAVCTGCAVQRIFALAAWDEGVAACTCTPVRNAAYHRATGK